MQNEVKNLGNISVEDAKKTTSDIEVFGNGDAWLLISKASSKSQGWMKSTKAMEIEGIGCLIQVTTEHRMIRNDGTLGEVTACSDSITFVNLVKIKTTKDKEGKVILRELVPFIDNVVKIIDATEPNKKPIKEVNIPSIWKQSDDTKNPYKGKTDATKTLDTTPPKTK